MTSLRQLLHEQEDSWPRYVVPVVRYGENKEDWIRIKHSKEPIIVPDAHHLHLSATEINLPSVKAKDGYKVRWRKDLFSVLFVDIVCQTKKGQEIDRFDAFSLDARIESMGKKYSDFEAFLRYPLAAAKELQACDFRIPHLWGWKSLINFIEPIAFIANLRLSLYELLEVVDEEDKLVTVAVKDMNQYIVEKEERSKKKVRFNPEVVAIHLFKQSTQPEAEIELVRQINYVQSYYSWIGFELMSSDKTEVLNLPVCMAQEIAIYGNDLKILDARLVDKEANTIRTMKESELDIFHSYSGSAVLYWRLETGQTPEAGGMLVNKHVLHLNTQSTQPFYVVVKTVRAITYGETLNVYTI